MNGRSLGFFIRWILDCRYLPSNNFSTVDSSSESSPRWELEAVVEKPVGLEYVVSYLSMTACSLVSSQLMKSRRIMESCGVFIICWTDSVFIEERHVRGSWRRIRIRTKEEEGKAANIWQRFKLIVEADRNITNQWWSFFNSENNTPHTLHLPPVACFIAQCFLFVYLQSKKTKTKTNSTLPSVGWPHVLAPYSISSWWHAKHFPAADFDLSSPWELSWCDSIWTLI